jgi:hypothetical protein
MSTNKSTDQQIIDAAVRIESARGVGIEVVQQFETMDYVINVRKGNKSISHRVPQFAWVASPHLIAQDIRHAVDSLLGESQRTEPRIEELERELAKYKEAVKQLSFDLEMATTSNKTYSTNVETERVIRKFALEQAAEYLNDHGVIRTSAELEQVCEQIKKLHPTRDIKMGQAAAAMNAMFTKKTEVPF